MAVIYDALYRGRITIASHWILGGRGPGSPDRLTAYRTTMNPFA